MNNHIERDIIDLLRSVMYSGAEENENMIAEVEDLGKLLEEYDGVPYEEDKNRLVVALITLRDNHPIVWRCIEHLND